MAVLTPVLTRRLQIETSLNAQAAKERLEASVAWLEDIPDVRFKRVGYSLTWLLMLDLPKSAKPLCAARHGDTVCITRTPGSWQTSLQPTGVVRYVASAKGTVLDVALEVSPRAARWANGFGVFSMVLGFVGFVLAMSVFRLSPLTALAAPAFCLLLALVNRAMNASMFTREVVALEEVLRRVLPA
jgi:hypothetical protein